MGTFLDSVSVKLRILRAFLTQTEAALTCDVGVKTWSSWETGRRTHNLRLVTLKRICEAFEVSLVDFIAWEVSPSDVETWREFDAGKIRQPSCYQAQPVSRDYTHQPCDSELDAVAVAMRVRENRA